MTRTHHFWRRTWALILSIYLILGSMRPLAEQWSLPQCAHGSQDDIIGHLSQHCCADKAPHRDSNQRHVYAVAAGV